MLENRGQRVVVVIGLGLALLLGWQALDRWTASSMGGGTDGGWFNYAPNNGAIFTPDPFGSQLQTNVGLRLAVQLCFIAVWVLASLWLLTDRPERTPEAGTADGPEVTG
jgi:hypothetical protein